MVRNLITRSIYLIAALCLLSLGSASANAATALIQGKITDKTTGKPMGVAITLLKPNGRTITFRSNASDGSYQQIVNAGTTYPISFGGYIDADNSISIDIPQSNSYQEIDKDFQLTELNVGHVLAEFQAFKPNETELTPEALQKLQLLSEYLQASKTVQIYVQVTSYDSWMDKERRNIEKTNSRGKKYTKRVTIKTEELLQEMLSARADALFNACKSNKIRMRQDDVKQDLQVVSEKKKRQSRINPTTKKKEWYIPEMPNVKIIVKKVMRL